jgi:hypothetical protein
LKEELKLESQEARRLKSFKIGSFIAFQLPSILAVFHRKIISVYYNNNKLSAVSKIINKQSADY